MIELCILKAYYWRESSLLRGHWVSRKKLQQSFIGDRVRGIVSFLIPYSNYKLYMVAVNGRGDGPKSDIKEFTTPEGGKFFHIICSIIFLLRIHMGTFCFRFVLDFRFVI